MSIDFAPGSATGDFDADAIEPMVNGETLDETNFQRPPENLRARTEVLREVVNDIDLDHQYDVNLVYWSDEDIVFDGAFDGIPGAPAAGVAGSGRLRVVSGGSIFIQPINATHQKFAELVLTGGGAGCTVTSKKYVYQGAHDIQFTVIDDVSGGAVSVSVAGGDGISSTETAESPKVDRRIEVHIEEGVHTLAQVDTAIAGSAATNALVNYVVDVGGNAFTVPVTRLADGADDVLYEITDAQLDAFFDADEDNLLQVGDALGISFDSYFDRHKKLLDRADTAILAADLFNSRLTPERGANAIPLFFAADTLFGYFATNDRCEELEEIQIGGGTGILEEFAAHIANVSNPHDVTAAQIDTEGGADRIVTQINAGTGSINGARVAVATTANRGAIKTSNNAGGDPIAIATVDKAVANGVASLNASALVPTTQLYNESFVTPLARRTAWAANGFVDLATLNPGNLEISIDGDAADGSYNEALFLEGDRSFVYLKIMVDKTNIVGDGMRWDVKIYDEIGPYSGFINDGSSTENLFIPTAGDQILFLLEWNTADHTRLIPAEPLFVRVEFDITSGTGAAYCQYAEFGVADGAHL